MTYIDLKVDYETPFGRIEQFYEQMGIFDIIRETKEKYNIPSEAYVPYKLLRCNQKTHSKLREQFFYNWKYYNYDRYTGKVLGGKKLRKYKKAHPLSHDDEARITWNYSLGCSPCEDDSVPDDIIRVIVEWDEDTIKDILNRYEIDKKHNLL